MDPTVKWTEQSAGTMDWSEIAKYVAFSEIAARLERIHWTTDGEPDSASIFDTTEMPYVEVYTQPVDDDRGWSQTHQKGALWEAVSGTWEFTNETPYGVYCARSDNSDLAFVDAGWSTHWITEIHTYAGELGYAHTGGGVEVRRMVCAHALGVKP